jgi:hypothetical protein
MKKMACCAMPLLDWLPDFNVIYGSNDADKPSDFRHFSAYWNCLIGLELRQMRAQKNGALTGGGYADFALARGYSDSDHHYPFIALALRKS